MIRIILWQHLSLNILILLPNFEVFPFTITYKHSQTLIIQTGGDCTE